MKIAMVHPRLDARGGAESVVLWLAQGLARRGHDVCVATRGFDAGAWPQGAWDGIPIHAVHGRQPQPCLAGAAVQPERYPWLTAGAPSFPWQVRRTNRADHRLDLRAAERVDAILTNSAFTATRVSAVYGRPSRPCPPGIPVPAEGRAAPPERPYLAWVSSPLVHKNAAGFLEALRVAICERGARDLRVRAVGLCQERFRARAAQLGVADAVVFEPWLPDDALQRLIASSRLAVYPSLDEPFGLVPVEAMAHARPVVASDRGGPAEVVVPGQTGLLADPLDPAAMADAVLELWNDPERADRLGAAGRERFLAGYTLEGFLDRFERLALAA